MEHLGLAEDIATSSWNAIRRLTSAKSIHKQSYEGRPTTCPAAEMACKLDPSSCEARGHVGRDREERYDINEMTEGSPKSRCTRSRDA